MMGFARYGGFGRGFGRGMWGGGHLFMGLICLVLLVALIVWIVWMVTWRRHGMRFCAGGWHGMHTMHDGQDMMRGRQDEALDILRKRFASGEIAREEYDERLKVLNGEK